MGRCGAASFPGELGGARGGARAGAELGLVQSSGWRRREEVPAFSLILSSREIFSSWRPEFYGCRKVLGALGRRRRRACGEAAGRGGARGWREPGRTTTEVPTGHPRGADAESWASPLPESRSNDFQFTDELG